MIKLLFIGFGGAIGTIFRYLASGIDYKFSNGIFPVSTLAINLTGSFVIGLLWGFFEHLTISPSTRMFIFVGILGGFTTFSTFSLENFNLLRDGEVNIVVVNILLSNLGGILLVFAGFFLSKIILNSLIGG